jgi:hypothetical protein
MIRKPRVLIVLAHFDETRNPKGRPDFVPQGTGHSVLAGAFRANTVEIRLYSEFHDGPLLDRTLFGWPDMLVLTGVTSAFDRMRQLTAYVRTMSPRCVVVVGGPVARNLPVSAAEVFDYVCEGDVEELQSVARDVFGDFAVAEHFLPRFDLLNWRSPVNYFETSRYCNFKCSFCALTGERRSYRSYDHAYIEAQIRSAPRGKYAMFIDNNFYGNNRDIFLAKLDLLRSLWKERLFKGWVALVTWDFFKDDRNLEAVREAGCLGLFSGIESLNQAQLRRYRKKQNLVVPYLQSIQSCLEAGLVFSYGLIFDPTTQSIHAMRNELMFVTGEKRMPLPAFLSLAIPLLGTPMFHDCARNGSFLPLAKLRDMDGFTLMTRPLDPIDEVARFSKSLARLEGFGGRILSHCLGFYSNYRKSLSGRQMAHLLSNSARLIFPTIIHRRGLPIRKSDEDQLTYLTTTQPLGPLYTPHFRISEAFRSHFEPTMITDQAGVVSPELLRNLEASRTKQP